MFSYSQLLLFTFVFATFNYSSFCQEFTFDFDLDNRIDVFTDSTGLNPVGTWRNLDIDGKNSGSLFFEGLTGHALTEVKLGSSSTLNWVDTGLGVGSSSLIESDTNGAEFISFVFSQPVSLGMLDFVSFNEGGGDAVDLSINGDRVASYFAPSQQGLRDDQWIPGTYVPAHQEIKLIHAGGSFLIQKMTVSVVPEPATVIGVFLAGGIALFSRKRV